MGCKESKQAGPAESIPQLEENSDTEEELAPVDMSGMDAFQKFEYSFPLHRMQIQDFEARVKKLVFGKQTLTFKQLQFSFRGLKGWEDLENSQSLFFTLLKSEFFAEGDEISVPNFLLWGLILCRGDANVKSRVFYDILQDQLQESIAASDKDFDGSFDALIFLATKMVYMNESKISGAAPVRNEAYWNKLDSDKMEEIREEFLDEVFGPQSKMARVDYMEAVAKKAPWIFSATEIRKKIDAAI